MTSSAPSWSTTWQDLPRFNLGLVVKKSEYFPYIMDVDKSVSKGASVGRPMEALKVVVRALNTVVGETRMLFEHRDHAKFSRAVPGHHSGQQDGRAHPREAAGCADHRAPPKSTGTTSWTRGC